LTANKFGTIFVLNKVGIKKIMLKK